MPAGEGGNCQLSANFFYYEGNPVIIPESIACDYVGARLKNFL